MLASARWSAGRCGTGEVEVANSGVSSGTLSVISGGSLILNSVLILANGNIAGQNAVVNVNGANSLLSLSGPGQMTVGAGSNGAATVNIAGATNGGPSSSAPAE